MSESALQSLLRNAERQRYWFTFSDGVEMLADVVCASHVDLNDTVMIAPVVPSECGWQIHLADIRVIADIDRRILFQRVSNIK